MPRRGVPIKRRFACLQCSWSTWTDRWTHWQTGSGQYPKPINYSSIQVI